MGSIEFKEIIDNLEIDDIRHVKKIEWYDGDYLKAFEYHQIKANKEDK